MRLRNVFLLVVVSFFPGCATTSTELTDIHKSKIKNVGVAVLLHDEFVIGYVSPFTRKLVTYDMNSSNYRKELYNITVNHLKSKHYRVKQLILNNHYRKEIRQDRSGALDSILKNLASENNLDTIILVYDGIGIVKLEFKISLGVPSHAYIHAEGYGVVNRTAAETRSFGIATIQIIDTRTMDTIVERSVSASERYHDQYIVKLVVNADKKFELTESQRNNLEESFSKHLSAALTDLLAQINL